MLESNQDDISWVKTELLSCKRSYGVDNIYFFLGKPWFSQAISFMCLWPTFYCIMATVCLHSIGTWSGKTDLFFHRILGKLVPSGLKTMRGASLISVPHPAHPSCACGYCAQTSGLQSCYRLRAVPGLGTSENSPGDFFIVHYAHTHTYTDTRKNT